MDSKTAKIISYISWIGLVIALLAGPKDRDEGLKQHLNQSLVCVILCIIPIGITQLAALIFAIMGIVKACQDDDEPLPLIGGISIIK